MDRFKEARDRGCNYLIRQLRPDGGFGRAELGVSDYYKVPSALLVCGHSSHASRLLDWVRRNGIALDGDFGPRPEEANGYAYTYYNSWVIIGAHRLGQFDLSQRGMDFLMDFWDPESGGFYSSPTEREDDTKQDLWVVSGCGQAALYTGMIDVARGVGRWMHVLMRGQPNYPEQMYTVFSRAKGLHTEPDAADEERYVLNSDATRDQYFFHPGIAGGFLARLYQATQEKEWLDLAKEYMRFAEGANDYLFRLLRAGKVGWAASVLYTLTGEAKYREMAVRVGENIIEAQLADGYWSSVGEDGPSNDATAEMVVWLDEIYQAVGHED
jgi:hypothetical protein